MRILVTGAYGLLGQKLTALLDDDPAVELLAAARKRPTHAIHSGVYLYLDVTEGDDVLEVVRRTKPDRVIHTAALTQVDQCETERELCWKNNVTAVGHLIKACETYHVHFVHLSTDFVFDGSHGPLDERAEPRPLSYYGQSKLASEELVRQSKLEWAIIRTILVYGVTSDMGRSNIVLWVKKSLEEGKQINVVNDQWRTPTLAEDLAVGCALASKKKARGIFHVSGSEMMTPYDIAIRTAEYFKLDKSLIHPTDSTKFKQPAPRPLKTGFIIDKAKRELGFEPHTFEQGLAIVAEQIRRVKSEK